SSNSDLKAFGHNPSNGNFAALTWMYSSTLTEFCLIMIGRAVTEGSKSYVAINAQYPQARHP
ncbi:hypothetical protein CONCODRAFT_36760, partial [Conidiobolus coronatus NRRL 28638]